MEWNANGAIRRMDHGDIMLNLFLGNEMDGGLANVYLRKLGDNAESTALVGPRSPSVYQTDERGFTACGQWGGLAYRVRLVLAESATAWFWHVEIENKGSAAVTCDLIHTQDIGLAQYGAIRLNEYYVSQYVDHTPLEHAKHGIAVASRQNQSMGGRCPWTVIGSLGRGMAYATDALQFHGLATRAGDVPVALTSGLPGKRLQHEHSMVSIQDAPVVLKPGAKARSGFFGWFVPDKPSATSAEDAKAINAALALPDAAPGEWPATGNKGTRAAASLFASAPLFEALELDEAAVTSIFGESPRHVERDRGVPLSFFAGDRSHVVLKGKELKVLRPHGHLLRTGGSLVPDESALTSTAWMSGVFHSMVTQGHVSINRFLSTCHTYLGLYRSYGQRVFVKLGDTWHLLDVPSGFEMTPYICRWIYKHERGLIEVISCAPDDKHELGLQVTVLDGPAMRFLVSNHVSMNGDDGSGSIPVRWEKKGHGAFVRAISDSDVGRRFPEGGFLIAAPTENCLESIGGDELLFPDGVSRNQPFLCFATRATRAFDIVVEGRLIESAETGKALWKSIRGGLQIRPPQASALAGAAERASEIFLWFIHNALVHYLSPRGLEQYSGGGWGTRDVCQGPVELLLALGRFEPIRDLLCRVFKQQNADGDWPQWFMFFDRERNIRPGDSHGDIVYWPLVALAQYLSATGDAGLLDEPLPYFHADGDAAAEKATVWEHVERALALINRRVIAGTHLAAYGHGDWNDSLQPAKPEMRERLCSSWTVTLNYQTFIALAGALRRVGNANRAADLKRMADTILDEFKRVLIVDDVVAGLAYFHEGGKIDHLLHPRDRHTQLSYSVLPMIHAIINDMFTPQQAEQHLTLIREHLLGPDGVRLFDRPLAYHGGPQRYFQRAESASFFGREIGIMYTHAHLRYCEALARFGAADDFFRALSQMNPIAIRDVVPTATLRQANCYFSSSDAAFADRYEAFEQYDKVKGGDVPLEGGWRVYSSGAGIGVRLIMQCFLGLRQEKAALVIDPVIPAALDGLKTEAQLAGHKVTVVYQVVAKGAGVLTVRLNGKDVAFERESNAYRSGAARISMEAITKGLTGNRDKLSIVVS
jgi:cellobiose phosphorylase